MRALGANARKLAGEELGYAEEVELVYGIEPRWQDEAVVPTGAASSSTRRFPEAATCVSRYARWFERDRDPGRSCSSRRCSTRPRSCGA